MFIRFGLILIFAACIVPFEKAYGGVVTLGNGADTNSLNTLTTSFWIRFSTVANSATSFNLTSIKLIGSGSDSAVSYKLYDRTGTSLVNSISGSGTMSNGSLSLTGKNSFGGGGTSATYVLQISGLNSSTYYRSSYGTSSQSGAALYLPSSNTGFLTNAYEQTSLTDSTRVGGGSSYAVTLSITAAVPEPGTFFLMGTVLLVACIFTCLNSIRKNKSRKRMA
jgi:hypothetical protein